MTPLEEAEELFTTCVISVKDIEDIELRNKKYEDSKIYARKLIESRIAHYQEVLLQFENILETITKTKIERGDMD